MLFRIMQYYKQERKYPSNFNPPPPVVTFLFSIVQTKPCVVRDSTVLRAENTNTKCGQQQSKPSVHVCVGCLCCGKIILYYVSYIQNFQL